MPSSVDDITSPPHDAQSAAGEDADSAPWHLIVLVGPDFGEIFPLLPGMVYVLGRGAGTDLTLDDNQLSRQQARLRVSESCEISIVDAGSSNGTRVNGAVIDVERTLRDGDRIRVGATTLKVMGPSNAEVRYHASMYRLVTVDDLTGAHTRRFLMSHLRRCLEGPPAPMSLIMLDIDYFKDVNDEHGHPVGDAVLVGLVDRLRSGLRADAIVARYGGEEFAVVLPMRLSAATRVAHRLLSIVADAAVLESPEVWLTVSMGVADQDDLEELEPGHARVLDMSERARELIAVADSRLLVAKERGRNQVCANGGDPSTPPATVAAARDDSSEPE